MTSERQVHPAIMNQKCLILFRALNLPSLFPSTLRTMHLSIHHRQSVFATLEVLRKFEIEEVRKHMVGVIVGIICVIFFGHIQFGSQAPVEMV